MKILVKCATEHKNYFELCRKLNIILYSGWTRHASASCPQKKNIYWPRELMFYVTSFWQHSKNIYTFTQYRQIKIKFLILNGLSNIKDS